MTPGGAIIGRKYLPRAAPVVTEYSTQETNLLT